MIENGNITIDGYDFKMESVTTDNSTPYRELVTTKVMGGTEVNTQGDWVGRSFSFTTFLHIDENQHDAYDTIFKEMMNKPCEVICQSFGGLFNAQIIIKKQPIASNPHGLDLTFSVKELPSLDEYYNDISVNNENRQNIVG